MRKNLHQINVCKGVCYPDVPYVGYTLIQRPAMPQAFN